MNNKQKIWTLSFGIITAMVIVVSQLFWFQASALCKKTTATEQKADKTQDTQHEAQITLPSSSLPAPNTVVVENDFSFIQEILFEKETSSEVTSTMVSTAGKFFHTLFRTIISPNAP